MPETASVTVAGFLFGLSLIVAIGAQNTYVLRQGVARDRIGLVIAVCSLSDAALIALGVAGGGAATNRAGLMLTIRWIGVAFLLCYAALAVRRALGRSRAEVPVAAGPSSLAMVAATTLALTWLNPAVYLDTVVLLGSVANAHTGQQWWFAAGAAAASLLWFLVLGYGARSMGPLMRRPQAASALDGFIALVMTVTAVRLGLAA